MYKYFRESFTPNLAFIKDTGSMLETDRFFDFCIGDILRMNPVPIEMEIWLNNRKNKIKNAVTYDDKNRFLTEFFDDYRVFFEPPATTLS